MVRQRADKDRRRRGYSSRALVTEMIVYLLLETGLRVAELCNLRMRNLPYFHGKSEIEVEDGKGHKDRAVGISSWCRQRLDAYIRRYRHAKPDSWLFQSERGRQMKTAAVRGRLKTVGKAARIWLYRRNGQVKTRLSPHKFRHTHATYLLETSDNLFLVQDQLGHQKADTTAIYAKVLSARKQQALDRFHNVLFSSGNGDLSRFSYETVVNPQVRDKRRAHKDLGRPKKKVGDSTNYDEKNTIWTLGNKAIRRDPETGLCAGD